MKHSYTTLLKVHQRSLIEGKYASLQSIFQEAFSTICHFGWENDPALQKPWQ